MQIVSPKADGQLVMQDSTAAETFVNKFRLRLNRHRVQIDRAQLAES